MKKIKILGYFIGISIMCIIWSIIAHNVIIFPSLLQVFYNISTKLVNNLIVSSIFHTISRAILAFLISLFIGILTANIAYKSKFISYIIQPVISLLRSIPTISIILIIIMLVDLELITYLIVFMITYPIIHQSVLYSLNKIDNELILVNKMDNTNSIKNYFLFFLPMSYSGIFNSIMQTFGLSIKIQIMSELLIGSTNFKGIGILLNYYKNNLELDNLFAITFIVIMIVFILETILKYIYSKVKI